MTGLFGLKLFSLTVLGFLVATQAHYPSSSKILPLVDSNDLSKSDGFLSTLETSSSLSVVGNPSLEELTSMITDSATFETAMTQSPTQKFIDDYIKKEQNAPTTKLIKQYFGDHPKENDVSRFIKDGSIYSGVIKIIKDTNAKGAKDNTGTPIPGSNIDIVIVGGGPSGELAAFMLVESGFNPAKITILESRPDFDSNHMMISSGGYSFSNWVKRLHMDVSTSKFLPRYKNSYRLQNIERFWLKALTDLGVTYKFKNHVVANCPNGQPKPYVVALDNAEFTKVTEFKESVKADTGSKDFCTTNTGPPEVIKVNNIDYTVKKWPYDIVILANGGNSQFVAEANKFITLTYQNNVPFSYVAMNFKPNQDGTCPSMKLTPPPPPPEKKH